MAAPLLSQVTLSTLIPFPARRVKRFAERLLICSASRERLSTPSAWTNRPAPPEPLGNMMQRLALRSPAAVLLVESVVADMLAELDRQ